MILKSDVKVVGNEQPVYDCSNACTEYRVFALSVSLSFYSEYIPIIVSSSLLILAETFFKKFNERIILVAIINSEITIYEKHSSQIVK